MSPSGAIPEVGSAFSISDGDCDGQNSGQGEGNAAGTSHPARRAAVDPGRVRPLVRAACRFRAAVAATHARGRAVPARERSYGAFQRAFPLPDGVDRDRAPRLSSCANTVVGRAAQANRRLSCPDLIRASALLATPPAHVAGAWMAETSPAMTAFGFDGAVRCPRSDISGWIPDSRGRAPPLVRMGYAQAGAARRRSGGLPRCSPVTGLRSRPQDASRGRGEAAGSTWYDFNILPSLVTP
jgi:hypothetical protein